MELTIVVNQQGKLLLINSCSSCLFNTAMSLEMNEGVLLLTACADAL